MMTEQKQNKSVEEKKILFICLSEKVKVKQNNLFHTYEIKR